MSCPACELASIADQLRVVAAILSDREDDNLAAQIWRIVYQLEDTGPCFEYEAEDGFPSEPE